MFNFELDNMQSQYMINSMSRETNSFNMYGRFMPSFEIRSLKSSPSALKNFRNDHPEIDILADANSNDEDTFPIDLDKLSLYIEF